MNSDSLYTMHAMHTDDTIIGPALITQEVQVSNKPPIRPGGSVTKGGKEVGSRPDYSQTHFHAVQVLRHVPPSSRNRCQNSLHVM
jgi:hypothetical protein